MHVRRNRHFIAFDEKARRLQTHQQIFFGGDIAFRRADLNGFGQTQRAKRATASANRGKVTLIVASPFSVIMAGDQ